MKKSLCFVMLLFMCGICWGCGQGESGIAKNTEDYDTAYHAKADISIKIGESLESVEEKIKDLSPERTEGENGLKYTFREDDNMEFHINFDENNKVKALGFFPYSFGQPYDEAQVTAGAEADCDWFFKGGVSAQTTKEEMDTNFGLPSWEDSSAGTYQCTYAFTDDFSLIEKAEYETYVAAGASYGIYSGFALFNAGKLVAFSIGQNE